MAVLSPQFIKTVHRLTAAGIFILIAFPLGFLTYIYTAFPAPNGPALQNFEATMERVGSQTVTLHIQDQKFLLDGITIKSWVEPYTRSYNNSADLRFSDRMTDYLNGLAKKTDRPAVDAKFTIENGKATIFAPAQSGTELDTPAATAQLRNGLLAGQTDINLPVKNAAPAITLETINNLGINTKIAGGVSDFSGSTAARIQNIRVASAKYNGLIINPGETFSFDTILGSVEATDGYAPEKVIKNGKIEYEYGGGICQVSTTLFRAAIQAGFPILERKNHAFPVHYYEPQGFDATIYPGVADLKFTNNTASHVLIQVSMVGKKLTFDLYGTGDGRTVTVDGPHEYDVQSDGSMKAYFIRTINFADGSSISQKFTSIYRSPALFPTQTNPYE